MRAVRPLAVLLLALVMRLVAHSEMAAAPDTWAPMIDSEAYVVQALRVAAGEDIVEGVYFQAPLYPWVLGGALALAGVEGRVGAERTSEIPPAILASAIEAGATLNLVLGVLTCLVVWALGRAAFGEAAGLIAGVLAALYGPALFYEGHLLKVSLSLLLLSLAVLLGAWAIRRDRLGLYLTCGLVLGLGALVRGNVQIVSAVAMAACVLAGFRRGAVGRGVLCAGALGLGVVLAFLPVAARNSLVLGQPSLSSATPGTAFYLCNHKGNAVGMIEHTSLNRQVPRYEQQDWQREAETRLGRVLTPSEVSSYWFGQALHEIVEDPGRYLLAQTRKLFMLASRYEAPDNTQVALGQDVSRVLAWTPSRYGLLVPLALVGMWVARSRRRRGVVAGPGQRGTVLALGLAGASYAGSLLLFTTVSRFRIPLAPLLMPWAALGLVGLWGAVCAAVRGQHPWVRVVRFGAVLAVGIGLGCVSEMPWPGPLDVREKARHRAVRLMNRAHVAYERGDESAARADLARAIEVSEDAGTVAPSLYATLAGYDRVSAAQAAARGQDSLAASLRSSAAALLRDKALALDPAHGLAQREAGMLAYELGNDAGAALRFEKALAAQPGDRVARTYLTLVRLYLGQPVQAEGHARQLVHDAPDADDGHGLLALALLALDRTEDATAAIAIYDRLAAEREALGLARRLPDRPEFSAMRTP